MKKVYFVFKDMKEATYYCRNLAYELSESGKHIKYYSNEKKIVIPRIKIEKENLIKRILIKLRKANPTVLENDIEINFKSINSDFTGIHQDIYKFLEDDIKVNRLIDFINKI